MKILIIILVAVQFVIWFALLLRFVNTKPGRCLSCGYSLSGIESAANCPECGTDLKDPMANSVVRLSRFGGWCLKASGVVAFFGAAFLIALPYVPVYGQVVRVGEFENGARGFRATGEGWVRSFGTPSPGITAIEFHAGGDRVRVVRQSERDPWQFADSGDSVSAEDVARALGNRVPENSLERVLSYSWHRSTAADIPVVVGSRGIFRRGQRVEIVETWFEDWSTPLLNGLWAVVLVNIAVGGVVWVWRRELHESVRGSPG